MFCFLFYGHSIARETFLKKSILSLLQTGARSEQFSKIMNAKMTKLCPQWRVSKWDLNLCCYREHKPRNYKTPTRFLFWSEKVRLRSINDAQQQTSFSLTHTENFSGLHLWQGLVKQTLNAGLEAVWNEFSKDTKILIWSCTIEVW